MANYSFPQFNVEIQNPSIEIDMNSIRDKAIDNLLCIDIVLTTPDSKFGIRLNDIPYVGNWVDADIPNLVNNRLCDFEI